MHPWIRAIAEADAAAFLAVNAHVDTGPAGVFMWLLTNLGLGVPLAIAAGAFLYTVDRRAWRRRFVVLVIVMATAGGFGQIIKRTVQRPRPVGALSYAIDRDRAVERPFAVFSEVTTIPFREGHEPPRLAGRGLVILGDVYTKRSFPSGHATAAFAAAMCIAYCLRRKAAGAFAFLVAAGIGFSRVYVGVHFPVDVAAGALLGTGWALGMTVLLDRGLALGLVVPRRDGARPKGPARVMIVAGEASADRYAANLTGAIKRRVPDCEVFGVGGTHLARAGADILCDASELSLMGFTDVAGALGRIRRIFSGLVDAIDARRPDVLVCIDLPDFNLLLAERAGERGVKVCYYISPQIWAWRRGRVKKIARRIDRMIVAFPFEKEFYQRAGVDVHFAGHPLLEVAVPQLEESEAHAYFRLDPDRPVVAILPGSRKSETGFLLEPLLQAAKRIAEKHPEVQFAVAVAPTVHEREIIDACQRAGVDAVITRDKIHDLFSRCRFGLITSGTATLEAALAALPMVIVYRGTALNVAIARRLVKVDFIGLPNLIAQKAVVPELIQQDATPENIAAAALRVLDDPREYDRVRGELEAVRDTLSGEGTSDAVAGLVLDLVNETS